MATYLEKYQQHLETRLSKGGTPKEMDAYLVEYNRVGDPSWATSEGFTEWLKTAELSCLDCRAPYQAEPNSAPQPQDATRCPKCGKVPADAKA